jgi:hypothetical protein
MHGATFCFTERWAAFTSLASHDFVIRGKLAKVDKPPLIVVGHPNLQPLRVPYAISR